MKSLVFLTSDYANISSDGKLNVMGVFNKIFCSSFPARHPSMHLVIKICLELGKSKGPYKLAVLLFDQDKDRKLILFENKFSFTDPDGGIMPEHTAVIGIRNLVFPEEGTYEFVLDVSGQQLGILPLEIRKLKEGLGE